MKGGEIFSGSKSAAKEFMDAAAVVYKNEGQIAMENFFFAKQASNEIKLLHSQTGETFVGKLLKKKSSGEYYYELHDFQYGKKNWTPYDKVEEDIFSCEIHFADPEIFPLIGNKKYFYGDIFIPPNLNATLQANKTGLTDLSLGEIIINDGFAALTKDIGKDLDGIFGVWQKNSSYINYPGGQSVNLSKLKSEMLGKAITKENLEAAALKTFTGKWAQSKGYGKPELYDAINQFRAIEALGDIELIKDIRLIFKK